MSGLGVAAIAGIAVWLGVLTLSLVLAIRQIALLTALIERAGVDFIADAPDEGPPVGASLPNVVTKEIPELGLGSVHLLLLAASCGPCRRVAEDLHAGHLSAGNRLVALVPGRQNLADDVVDMLPPKVKAVRDPAATEVANLLQINRVPFAMAIRDGVVAAKAPILSSADDLIRFLNNTSPTRNGREASLTTGGGGHGSERPEP